MPRTVQASGISANRTVPKKTENIMIEYRNGDTKKMSPRAHRHDTKIVPCEKKHGRQGEQPEIGS